ncbi:hypothetical protein CDAR_20821, partial [Caerostris darwini]
VLTQEYGKGPYHRRGDIAHITRARDRAYRMMITTSLTFVLFLIPYAATVVWRLSAPPQLKTWNPACSPSSLRFRVFQLRRAEATHQS